MHIPNEMTDAPDPQSDQTALRRWLKRGTGSYAQAAFELGRSLDTVNKLQSDKRALMRAARDLCHALQEVKFHSRSRRMRATTKIPREAAAELTALWDLCKDTDPTEE